MTCKVYPFVDIKSELLVVLTLANVLPSSFSVPEYPEPVHRLETFPNESREPMGGCPPECDGVP